MQRSAEPDLAHAIAGTLRPSLALCRIGKNLIPMICVKHIRLGLVLLWDGKLFAIARIQKQSRAQ